ncbi:MAG: hypothetical protein NZL93_02215 [Chthoniobacterales bacterium]|nr:hypothetical protein [Chthoniobacterales bacterium]
MSTLEGNQGGTTLAAHRSVATLDHPDGSVTAAKLAPGAAVANIGYTPLNRAGDAMVGVLDMNAELYVGQGNTQGLAFKQTDPSEWLRAYGNGWTSVVFAGYNNNDRIFQISRGQTQAFYGFSVGEGGVRRGDITLYPQNNGAWWHISNDGGALRFSHGGTPLASVMAELYADGVFSARYNHQWRFPVSIGGRFPSNVTLGANGFYDISIHRIFVPAGWSLILRRVRYNVEWLNGNLRVDIYTTFGSSWTSSGPLGETTPNATLINNSPGIEVNVSVWLFNSSSSSINISANSFGVWFELELRPS